MILAVPLLLAFVVIKIVSGDTGAAVLIFVVPVLAGVGIWMAGLITTITFNSDTESMTVTRGHIPLFLWWLRTKCISRQSARTVNVTCHLQVTDMIEYWVEVMTAPGQKLTLFKWDNPGEADDLMKRIKRWSGPEC
jgi:hypothetical protein